MSVTSDRSVVITSTGDVEYSQEFPATTNPLGSGQNQLVELAAVNNTISVPVDAVAMTIIKPTGNTAVLKIKGLSGDTGLTLGLTGPDSFSIDATIPIIIHSSAIVTVRLIFS